MMKKKILALALLAALSLGLLSGCGNDGNTGGNTPSDNPGSNTTTPEQNSGDVYSMIVGSGFTAEHYTGVGLEAFKKHVEEASDGRIEVKIFYGATVASTDAQKCEMLSNGSMQMDSFGFSFLGTYINDKRATFDAIPYFLMDDGDNDRWLYFTDHSEALADFLDEVEQTSGIRLFGFFPGGDVSVAYKGEPCVDDLSNFAGKKVRAPENDCYIYPFQAMGASPTPLAFGEIYTSIQQGAIDGVVTSTTHMLDYGFYDINDVLLDIKLFPTVFVTGMNSEWYHSLPDDLRAIVDEGAEILCKETRKAFSEVNETIYEKAEAAGCKVVTMDGPLGYLVKDCVADYTVTAKAQIEEIDPEFWAALNADIEKYFAEYDAQK